MNWKKLYRKRTETTGQKQMRSKMTKVTVIVSQWQRPSFVPLGFEICN